MWLTSKTGQALFLIFCLPEYDIFKESAMHRANQIIDSADKKNQ